MVQKIELNLNAQNSQSSFVSFDIQIESEEKIKIRQSGYINLESIKNIQESLNTWQSLFEDAQRMRRVCRKNTIKQTDLDLSDYDLDVEEDGDCTSCTVAYEQLITDFNLWLNSDPGWQKIRNCLTENLNQSESEIQVIIQTENHLLKQLPWQEWQVFEDYPETEIAISLPEYQPPQGFKNIKRYPQVRILVILGDDEGISLKSDKKLINDLKEHGAYLEFVTTLSSLQDELTSKKWDILYYAGHSKTNEQGQGVVYIENNIIAIYQIEEQLKTAIKNGLYLAIFNSCDGLGIANKLAELHLPQSIVMKEIVPDEMAIDFLKQFLSSFSRDQSLFTAVNKARKFLKDKYNQRDQYPGGHLLPIIVLNPSVPLYTWKSFLSEYQLPLKWLIPAIIAGTVAVVGLPVSLIYEFGLTQSLFYAKLYPHIILYPVFTFWAALWGVYKAFCQIMNKKAKSLIWKSALILCISISLLLYETTLPNMFLFEFSSSAQSTVTSSAIEKVPEIKGGFDSIKAIPADIMSMNNLIKQNEITINKANLEQALHNYLKLKDSNKLTHEQIQSFHNLMYLGLDYQATWKHQKSKSWWSVSRFFYLYTFWAILFNGLIFLVFWGENRDPRRFFNQIRFYEYLVFSEIMILLWFPLRLFYVKETKEIIFGTERLKELDPFTYIIITILFVITATQTIRQNHKPKMLIITIAVILFVLLIGHTKTEFLNTLLGFDSNPILWILLPIIVFFSMWFV